MKKRTISIILAIATLLSSVVVLSGCSTQETSILTVGQWLGMINNSFGMESYSQEEPYIASVEKDNEYFNTVQIAAEWGVIDIDKPINPSDTLLYKDALIYLVNVGNFTKNDATDEEKIQYAIEHFNRNIRSYWMNRNIDVATASALLVEAQNQWANRTYDEPISKITYSKNVVELSDSAIGMYEVTADDVVLMSESSAKHFEVGEIFVLPDQGKHATPRAYKVEDIKIENGVAQIKTSDNLELGDFVDELYIENTFSPDLTEAEFYDGNGNLLSRELNVVPQSSKFSEGSVITNLAYNSNSFPAITQLASKTTFSFEVDGCKVELTKKTDGLSAKIEMPLSEKDDSFKGYYELEVSNFTITNKIDYSWFTLHSAEIKVDYTTKNTIGVKRTYVDESAVYAPKWSNGNGSFLTNLKRAVWKNTDSVGAKTIKIGRIEVASVGVASFSVDVYAKLKVDGSAELSCKEVGCKGIEYKKGNCRVINTCDKDTDVQFKCKAEGTVSVAPTVNAFGFAIIGLKAETGLGAEASLTLHLADADNHLLQEMSSDDVVPEVVEAMEVTGLTADAEEIKKLAEEQGATFQSETSTVELHLDRCIDINVYFILRVGIEEETLAGKLLKGTKIKVTWEIFGSKNARICNLHVENGDWATAFSNIAFFSNKDQCTMKYKPFDGVEEASEQEETIVNDNEEIGVGEALVISDMKLILEIGSTQRISVVQIPKGYELKDVVCKSTDDKIATIDKNGEIKAVGEGSTTVIIQTSDGKYACACSVTVAREDTNTFTPLSVEVYDIQYKGMITV